MRELGIGSCVSGVGKGVGSGRSTGGVLSAGGGASGAARREIWCVTSGRAVRPAIQWVT